MPALSGAAAQDECPVRCPACQKLVQSPSATPLRNFGLKVGMVGKVRFEARIQELVETFPDLAALVEPLPIVRRVLRGQIVILHRRSLAIVRDDDVCRRLMTTSGVGLGWR
jgi:hypothetical protein